MEKAINKVWELFIEARSSKKENEGKKKGEGKKGKKEREREERGRERRRQGKRCSDGRNLSDQEVKSVYSTRAVL